MVMSLEDWGPIAPTIVSTSSSSQPQHSQVGHQQSRVPVGGGGGVESSEGGLWNCCPVRFHLPVSQQCQPIKQHGKHEDEGGKHERSRQEGWREERLSLLLLKLLIIY